MQSLAGVWSCPSPRRCVRPSRPDIRTDGTGRWLRVAVASDASTKPAASRAGVAERRPPRRGWQDGRPGENQGASVRAGSGSALGRRAPGVSSSRARRRAAARATGTARFIPPRRPTNPVPSRPVHNPLHPPPPPVSVYTALLSIYTFPSSPSPRGFPVSLLELGWPEGSGAIQPPSDSTITAEPPSTAFAHIHPNHCQPPSPPSDPIPPTQTPTPAPPAWNSSSVAEHVAHSSEPVIEKKFPITDTVEEFETDVARR